MVLSFWLPNKCLVIRRKPQANSPISKDERHGERGRREGGARREGGKRERGTGRERGVGREGDARLERAKMEAWGVPSTAQRRWISPDH